MARQSRRDFLENSLFAAAAAASAGSLAASPVRAQASSSPNERLRVAVLGVRSRGQSHLEGMFNRSDVEVVAIVDPDEAIGQSKGVERVEKETGRKPTFYRDPRQVMDDQSIDIVTIATPNHWHALAAIWAVQNGKDVYVEKPVSHNVSEGRRIVQAARKHKRIVQTGTQCRSMPATIEAVEYVKSGHIGEVSLARGLCYKRRDSIGKRGTYEIPQTVDYNVWLGPAPEEPLTRPKLHYDWHWVWSTGNGDLGNQGIHQMDICRWGLGVNDIGKGVLSYGGRFGYEDAGETANTQVNIHDYGDKRLEFEVRGLPTEPLRGAGVGVIFYGSEGYVVLTSYSRGAAFDLDGNVVKKFEGGNDRMHYDNFLEAVRSRNYEDLHADIEQGHLSSALCHLGNISYRLGESLSARECAERLKGHKDSLETFERFAEHLGKNEVDLEKTPVQFGVQLAIDPKREVFVGDHSHEASQLLTRDYRKGFVVPGEADV